MTDGNKRERRNWWRRLAATGTTDIELTDFHKAAHDGNDEEIKRLLESASVDINRRCYGKTALEMAIISKKVSAALLLINAGASLYFEHERNALCAASFHGLKEVAQAAIDKGIDVNEAFYWPKPPMRPAIKTYPIQYAVQSGDADTVAYLLEEGANLNRFKVYPFGAHYFLTQR
ncbi:uncharacterized protein FFNC_15414 [Fusarium fujikuroi]|nr:uncharacterized protein FFNC_15414 [Fusarium fujikuroi]